MSRTYHHTWCVREELSRTKKMPWWKLGDFPSHWIKQQWASKVRSYHKQEMLRNPEDPALSQPRKITDPWDWY